MSTLDIQPYSSAHQQAVLDLTVATWTPVFEKTEKDVPSFVLEAFYPDGWETRQTAEVAQLLQSEPENIWLAFKGTELAGFIGLKIHPEDQMGEIYIIAVHPEHQRQGIGAQLMTFGEQKIIEAGMKMVMVETIGDAGHAPARMTYESQGFERWPVARYFKKL